MLTLALLEAVAHAHTGAVPIRGVYDWSQLPTAEPGAWVVWTLFPSVVIGCLLFVVGYELLAGPLRERWSLSPVGPTTTDRVMFHGGIALVFCSLQGPLHELADVYLFSGHMVQHLAITLLFPPMAIRGIPPWMWTPVTRRPWAVAVGRALTNPFVALGQMTAVLWIWHFPVMYDWALVDHNVHIVEHLTFMASFVVMWWPAHSRLDAIPALTPGTRMVYLFLCTIPMKALGAILTMSDYVLYGWYASQPRVFGLDPLTDQRAGGLIMWLPGGLVFWVSIGITFFRYYGRDRLPQHTAPQLVAMGEK
jgi:putative membrane protein